MSRTHRTTKTKIIGERTYIDTETGEEVSAAVTVSEDKDFNFKKIWISEFISRIEDMTNKKTDLAFWIVEHMDKENQLTYTYRQIVDEYKKTTGNKICIATVTDTMRILLENDFLRRKNTGCYIINPDVIFNGKRYKRLNIMNEYVNINETGEEDPTTEEQLEQCKKELADIKALEETVTKQMVDLQVKLTTEQQGEAS